MVLLNKDVFKNPQFYINIFVGVVISVILSFMESTTFGVRTLDLIYDNFIRHENNSARELSYTGDIDSKISKDIVFIDFGYREYKKWGNPLITPRDEIAHQVHIADSNKASIIIVDFLFDYNDCCNPLKDDSLKRVLTRITNKGSTTKIIFPVQIDHNEHLKQLIYDDIIKKNENFFYAVPIAMVSSHDNNIRYTERYKAYKKILSNGDTVSSNIYSVSTLVKIIRENSIYSRTDIENNNIEQNLYGDKVIKTNENKNKIEEYIFKRRIKYLISPNDEYTSNIRMGNIPLGQYYNLENSKYSDLNKKIIILGSSNPESPDNHETPVGKMSGMFILGNTINTEIMNLYPIEIPFLINDFLEVLIILLTSYIFVLQAPFKAQLITSALLIIPFFILDIILFLNYGVILNFILPLIGISFHRNISSLEHLWYHKKKVIQPDLNITNNIEE